GRDRWLPDEADAGEVVRDHATRSRLGQPSAPQQGRVHVHDPLALVVPGEEIDRALPEGPRDARTLWVVERGGELDRERRLVADGSVAPQRPEDLLRDRRSERDGW